MDTRKKQKIEKVTKPYMKGAPTDRTTLTGALKFFFAMVAMTIAFLLIGVMMNWDNHALSLLFNGAIILGVWVIFHQTGANAGADAVNQGEIMLARQEKGRPVADWEARLCYHPLKGMISALLGAAPLVLISLVLACIAQRQVSNLGALPSWLGSIEGRPEIGAPLAYYHDAGTLSLEGLLRLIVRMSTMPYVNMMGAADKDAMLLLERLSPVLNVIPAIAYGLGYMSGTSIRSAVHTNIALGKKKAKRRQAKERRQRQQIRRGPEQLN